MAVVAALILALIFAGSSTTVYGLFNMVCTDGTNKSVKIEAEGKTVLAKSEKEV